MKKQNGISLIALIITIIVIVILAAIVIGVALTTPESANRAKFASNMSEVQHAVATKLAENYNQYVTNPDSLNLNVGFTRVQVNGAPASFNSFIQEGAETGTIGYLVKLDTIKMEQLTIGQEYKTATEATFGTTDAFVYDSEGEVFYALGYKYQGVVYYSVADLEAGGVAVEDPGEEEPTVDVSLIKGVNPPKIVEEMKAVYWDGYTEIEEEIKDIDITKWYDYVAQSGATVNAGDGTSKWANVKIDGSYFVWIPRYAYKIIYYTDATKQTVSGTKTIYGDIDILFMHGTSSTKYIDRATNTEKDLPAGYIVHPAFTNNMELGGWDSDLTGIWVGKYQASRTNATFSSAGSTNVLKVVPGVRSFDSLAIGSLFTIAKDYKQEFNSHMMKNSEWGAVAYLTHSKYGRNSTEVMINNNSNNVTGYAGVAVNTTSTTPTYAYNTPQGVLASTTGNIYGIYDMSGERWEYVSAYNVAGYGELENGSSFVYKEGTTINTDSTKYATVYRGASETLYNKTGDATYETASWNGDCENFPTNVSPFFLRGGLYSSGAIAGIFCYATGTGDVGPYSFHVCLAF